MSSGLASAGALFGLLAALGGEALFGEMRWLYARIPHPRLAVGLAVGSLDRRLNRASRGARVRLLRGALVAVVVPLAAGAAGLAIAALVDRLPYLWLAQLLLIMSLIAQRGPQRRVKEAAALLGQGGVIAGQEALRPMTGLRAGALDGLSLAGTVRVGVLALARAFVAGVAAPCFWFVLLGLPGLFMQQAVRVMAARFDGAGDELRYRDFGLTATRLDDALMLLPAAIGAAMLGLAAACVPDAHPAAAFEAAWRARRDPREWPAETMAAAVALDQSSGAAALERARMLHAVACLINAGAIAALALLLLSA